MNSFPTVRELFIKYNIDYTKIKKRAPLIVINDSLKDYTIECYSSDLYIIVINKKNRTCCFILEDKKFICETCDKCYCYRCYNYKKYFCRDCDKHYDFAFLENYDLEQILQLRININTWNRYRWGGYKITDKDVINLIYEKLIN